MRINDIGDIAELGECERAVETVGNYLLALTLPALGALVIAAVLSLSDRDHLVPDRAPAPDDVMLLHGPRDVGPNVAGTPGWRQTDIAVLM